MLKTINEAYDYLYSFINLEKNKQTHVKKHYSLDNIRKIVTYFDDPGHKLKFFHIAGTKGKGSVSLFLTALLQKLGFHVSNFLSPHLINPNERILYNGIPVSDQDFLRLTNQIKTVIEKHHLSPTTFELFFILYLLYSIERQVDYAVCETGLGGRLDCTNIITPIVSLITAISKDHVQVLGNTIEEIALEKAGIIKPQIPAVIGRQPYSCESVFSHYALKLNSPVYFTDEEIVLKQYRAGQNELVLNFQFREMDIVDFHLPLLGLHQVENFFCALKAVSLYFPEIIDILQREKKLDVVIPGRIQCLEKGPLLILDVSHNVDSARRLKETLLSHYPGKKWSVLTGIAGEKDWRGFYKELQELVEHVYITSLPFKESFPREIYDELKNTYSSVTLIESIDEAISLFYELQEDRLVTGSFYLAGPFLEYWTKKKAGN